jgi:hypothetical protein
MKISTCALMLLLAAVPAPAQDDSTKTWVFRDSVAFDLTDGWEFMDSGSAARIEILNRTLEASCMLVPSPAAATAAKYQATGIDREAILRQTLEQGLAPMLLARSIEKEIQIHPLPGSNPAAYYFTLSNTDGRFDTVAVNHVASMELVMVCGTASTDDIPSVLSILGSVRADSD